MFGLSLWKRGRSSNNTIVDVYMVHEGLIIEQIKPPKAIPEVFRSDNTGVPSSEDYLI